MNITKFQVKDKKNAEEFIKDILEEIFGRRDNNFKIITSKNMIFFVAKNKKKIVGTIALKKIYSHQGRLKHMYVDKKYRGKGLAQKLYDKILDYCNSNQINKIYLTTYPKMREAQKFYKKQGFRKTKRKYKDKRKQFILELK